MDIILIANFLPDRQESMERFALMLNDGLISNGNNVQIWRPQPYFGRLAKTTLSGFGKWLGYIDKWIVFPLMMRWRVMKLGKKRQAVKFHICDHSNAPYLAHLPIAQSSITCHDVLAIRGGLGYKDAFVGASRTGKIFQRWILDNLLRSGKIACVSAFTLRQLIELAAAEEKEGERPCSDHWIVVHNAFNNQFVKLADEVAWPLLTRAGFYKNDSYLLHVGSDLPRKNRKMLLDMFAVLPDNKRPQKICFAGDKIDTELAAHASQLGIEHFIISVVKPDHQTLLALYSYCEAFVFPSLSEGFGWPVIEAQACGAPVIASEIDPMPEVSGGAALHADPFSPQAFAAAYIKITNSDDRYVYINKGLENAHRFNVELMISSYEKLFLA